MSQELKVVIALKEGRGFIGVQTPECDPVWATLEGDLQVALSRVPEVVEEARRQWAESPRYRKYDRPRPPPQSPTQPAAPTPIHRGQASSPQQRFF